ncbi:MAG: flagellin [Candidatus Thermoplasmatota archaeon]
MGVGTMIIFIAGILIAGVVANVLIQTMNSLQQQAMTTGQETIREVASGVKITQVSGYVQSSSITQLAILVTPIAASEPIDLSTAILSLSDSKVNVILNYSSKCFNSSISNNGLFGTINTSNLTSTTYGVIVIRDTDSSCTVSKPIINDRDIVALIVNTTKCFSGIKTRTTVSGVLYPEHGITGIISFTTPSSFINTIVDLQ